MEAISRRFLIKGLVAGVALAGQSITLANSQRPMAYGKRSPPHFLCTTICHGHWKHAAVSLVLAPLRRPHTFLYETIFLCRLRKLRVSVIPGRSTF